MPMFTNGIADRVSRDEAVMAQVHNHSAEQVMHGLFPKRLIDLVLGSMTGYETLSMETLENGGQSGGICSSDSPPFEGEGWLCLK